MVSKDQNSTTWSLDLFFKGGFKNITQEQIILLIAAVFFVFFAFAVKGFATFGNITIMMRNISVLGIFSIGMGTVVIAKGIDLSEVAVGAMSAAWVLQLATDGMNLGYAILLGVALALFLGGLNGYLIAFIEIPALFATLASGIYVFGFVRYFLLNNQENHFLPKADSAFLFVGQGKIIGIPTPIVIFAAVALLAHLFLRLTRHGRFFYAMGDNEDAARMTGISIRPMKIFQYSLCSLIGYLAALVMMGTTGSINVRIVSSTLIFDVVLVVVLGGISLIGGRGSVFSVIAGVLLVGIILNGMTLLHYTLPTQDLIKGIILLGAILLDTFLHPRDEETARQGDI
ncbi:MAG: ABC transporter permease [Deltaproteobacteria bacterium]|nr:ABC transporter permease [Deltaproteobacteria bacterium]